MNIDRFKRDDSDKEVVAVAEVVDEDYLSNFLKEAGIFSNGTKVMLVNGGRQGCRMYGFSHTWSGNVEKEEIGPAYKLIRWL